MRFALSGFNVAATVGLVSCASTLGPQLPSANVSPFDAIDETILSKNVARNIVDVPSDVALECYAVAKLEDSPEFGDFFSTSKEDLDRRKAQYEFAAEVWQWLYLRDQTARDFDKKATVAMMKRSSKDIFTLKTDDERKQANYQQCVAPIVSWVVKGSSLYGKKKVSVA